MEHHKNLMRRGREWCNVGFLNKEQRNEVKVRMAELSFNDPSGPQGEDAPVPQSGTYRPAVRPSRLGGCIRAIVQLQVVVLATSRVVDVNLGKGDGQQPPSGCCDAPLAVGAVGVGPWVVGARKGAVVPVESATTT